MELNQSDDAILKALQELPTTNLSDAMDAIGIRGAMSAIRILDYGMGRVAGRARTLLQGPRRVGADSDTSYIGHVKWVEDLLRPRDFVVISVADSVIASSWGYLLSLRCLKRGASGTIVDGYIRDVNQLIQLGYPVFSRALGCPAGTKFRADTLSIDKPVECGGVHVQAGDFIVGDDSGVVVIPPDRALEILSVAKDLQSREAEVVKRIL